jgi:hypothetical protein
MRLDTKFVGHSDYRRSNIGFVGVDLTKLIKSFVCGGLLLVFSVHSFAADESGLSDVPRPYLSDDELPSRAGPIIEIGPKFLSTGNIKRGFTIPTGAVWTPSLWVYGNFRSAFHTYEAAADNSQQVQEWANRLDLFANLQLSGTERILLGVTPLHDRNSTSFSGKIFNPSSQEESIDATNLEIDTLFFEGDFAELFPGLDKSDGTKNDIGFTIGRQNIFFMDGFMVNDNLDGFGLSKNNIRFNNFANLINWRSSVFIGLSGVHRSDNTADDSGRLIGWFNQFDTIRSTYNFDVVYVEGGEPETTIAGFDENSLAYGGDLLNIGFDATQRFGKLNTLFRVAASLAVDEATPQSDDGVLLFTEISWVPAHTRDNAYINAFLAIDNYTSAARGPLEGGPLGRTGLLFAAQGLGTFPAPLSNASEEAAGFSVGYQKFSKDKRRQYVLEAGARFETRDEAVVGGDEFGIAARVQQALGKRFIIQVDAYATSVEDYDGTEYGARIELQVKL